MGGGYVCAGGLHIEKLKTIQLIYGASYFNLEGLGALIVGAKPATAKAPP